MMFNCSAGLENFPQSVVYLSLFSCLMSIGGTVFIFLTYWRIPEIRNSTRKLVTWLSVADFLTAIGILISSVVFFSNFGKEFSKILCTVQSAITTTSSLVSFFLTIAIAVHIFCSVVYRTNATSSTKFLIVANAVSWGVPVVIIVAALSFRVLGKDINEPLGTGSWCWIKCNDNINVIFWMLITGKAWEIFCYLSTTSLYVLLKLIQYMKFRHLGFQQIQSHLREEDHNFVYVWLVIFAIRVWGTVRFFMYVTNSDEKEAQVSSVFLHMQAVGDPAQGLCNFILFCLLDKTVRKKMVAFCLNKTENYTDPSAENPVSESYTEQDPLLRNVIT